MIETANHIPYNPQETNYTKITQEELQREVDYWRAYKILQRMLAAGDFPNFAQLQYWDTGFLYDSKLIRTVKRDMLYKYIPTLARYLDEEPFAWNLRKVTDTEDEYYGILWSTPQDTGLTP
jgi:hypothetical protein